MEFVIMMNLLLCIAFLDVPEIIDHLRSNYDYWKELDRQGIQSAGHIDAYNKLNAANSIGRGN